MKRLTFNEEEVMQLIWNLDGAFVKDILEAMTEPRPPYTTVASVVKNLERKGYVNAEKIGNTFRYLPVVKEEDYKKEFLSGFVSDYFSNSYKDLVAFFAKEEKITPDELKEILKLIEKGKA